MPEQWSQWVRDLPPARSVTRAASPGSFLVSQDEVDLATAASKALERTNQAPAQTAAVSTAAAARLRPPASAELQQRLVGWYLVPAAPVALPTMALRPSQRLEAQALSPVSLATLAWHGFQERLCFCTKHFHGYVE